MLRLFMTLVVTQIQYERAEARQNKIKNHNERQLQLMKEKNK